MPIDQSHEFQSDAWYELETRLAFQEQALTELSDALGRCAAEAIADLSCCSSALEDLKHFAACSMPIRRPNRHRRTTDRCRHDEQFPSRPAAGPGLQAAPKPERKPEPKPAQMPAAGKPAQRERAVPASPDEPRRAAARQSGARTSPRRKPATREEIDLAKAYAMRAQQEKDERIEGRAC